MPLWVPGRGLGFQIVEDALKYEDEPAFRQPALVLHGRRDEVVPAELSKVFAEGHPNVTLRAVRFGSRADGRVG